ncbi:MAG: hypothetical protein DCF23_04900 [Cyanobium sp.]|nr:MAG: hypothetical protein DCF23_04900 [Cyanobium sp.]
MNGSAGLALRARLCRWSRKNWSGVTLSTTKRLVRSEGFSALARFDRVWQDSIVACCDQLRRLGCQLRYGSTESPWLRLSWDRN